MSSTNYKTSYSYDKHGNVMSLQRYGKTTSAAYGLIDNVTLTYTGNQLTKADDTAAGINLSESNDFKNYINTAAEYTYNKNGAMTKDLNKGITAIQYNSLNLPRLMDIKSPVAEARNEYLYSAAGAKLRVVQKWNPNYSTTPVIGSAINTGSLTMTKTTDYAGNMIYENNQLKRILIDGGYIEGSTYHFYLTDHLGNNRVVANASGTAVQRNHYYPFGMPYAETPITEQSKQSYKFGDKELDQMHGLNLYDYHARQQDPQTGRFTSVDPLAEKYYSISPYVYCGNNPMRFIDPDGRSWWDKVIGVGAALADNMTWGTTNIRTTASNYVTDARDYNTGQDVGDIVSIVGGSVAVVDGGAKIGGSSVVTVGSGGTLTVVGIAGGVAGAVEAVYGAGVAVNATQSLIEGKGRMNETRTAAKMERTKKDPLRRNPKSKEPEVDPEAKGSAHSQLGTKKGSKGDYKQAREFDEQGRPVRDIDFTDHGRPQNHPNPHQHKYKDNSTGGTRQRNKKAEHLE